MRRACTETRDGAATGPPPPVADCGIDPEHPQVTAVTNAVPLAHLHGGGLAGPVRAEQGEHFAALHGEVNAVHHCPVAVALDQVGRLDHCVHGRIVRCVVAAPGRPGLQFGVHPPVDPSTPTAGGRTRPWVVETC
jgi:hypothetical protein